MKFLLVYIKQARRLPLSSTFTSFTDAFPTLRRSHVRYAQRLLREPPLLFAESHRSGGSLRFASLSSPPSKGGRGLLKEVPAFKRGVIPNSEFPIPNSVHYGLLRNSLGEPIFEFHLPKVNCVGQVPQAKHLTLFPPRV